MDVMGFDSVHQTCQRQYFDSLRLDAFAPLDLRIGNAALERHRSHIWDAVANIII